MFDEVENPSLRRILEALVRFAEELGKSGRYRDIGTVNIKCQLDYYEPMIIIESEKTRIGATHLIKMSKIDNLMYAKLTLDILKGALESVLIRSYKQIKGEQNISV